MSPVMEYGPAVMVALLVIKELVAAILHKVRPAEGVAAVQEMTVLHASVIEKVNKEHNETLEALFQRHADGQQRIAGEFMKSLDRLQEKDADQRAIERREAKDSQREEQRMCKEGFAELRMALEKVVEKMQ